MESRSSRRIPSRGREAPAPTADEQLDQLIEEARAERRAKARSEAPAVRAVKAEVRSREGQGASSSGGELVLSGLSPEQQGWLVRAANTFRAGGEVPRPEFLPPQLNHHRALGGWSRASWDRWVSSNLWTNGVWWSMECGRRTTA